VIVALSTFAGLFCTLAMGVGLIALYRAEAAAYGVDIALAIVAAVLVAAALILLGIAWTMGRSLSGARASRSAEALAKSAPASSAFAPGASGTQMPPPEAVVPPLLGSPGDLTGPLTYLLALAKDPKLGHPVIEELPSWRQEQEKVDGKRDVSEMAGRTRLPLRHCPGEARHRPCERDGSS
jgi:hypothetical protein